MKSALYPSCIDRDGELYQLNPSWTYSFDAARFDEAILSADRLKESDTAGREAVLSEAANAYKAHFFKRSTLCGATN